MLYNIFLIFCALLPFQFALNPSAGVDLAVVRVIVPLLFLAWLISAKKYNLSLFKKNNVTCFILIFLFLAVFSLSFSHNITWSLRKLAFLFSLAPIYFIAVSILDTESKRRKTIIALSLGAATAAVLGIIQFASQFIFGIDAVYSFLAKNITPFFLGHSFSQSVLSYPSWLVNSANITYMRAFATFPDPHMFSYYLGMLLPWSIVLWATTTQHKKLFFISSILLATADILTFTRGGYIALIAATLVVLPLVTKDTAKKLIAGIIFFILLFIFVPNNPVTQRLFSSFDVQEGSNQARLSNWQQALPIIAAHPFGVGIGMYSLTVKPTADYREPIYAHNLYLDIAAELGLLTALVFIALLFFAFRSFWQTAKNNPFFIAGVASVTVFSIHSLVENPLYSVHVLPIFLIILAISSVLTSNAEPK